MTVFDRIQARWICGMCGNPINGDEQVASLHLTRKEGGGVSIQVHALCLKPHLHNGQKDVIDDAATVDEQQRIWERAVPPDAR